MDLEEKSDLFFEAPILEQTTDDGKFQSVDAEAQDMDEDSAELGFTMVDELPSPSLQQNKNKF